MSITISKVLSERMSFQLRFLARELRLFVTTSRDIYERALRLIIRLRFKILK